MFALSLSPALEWDGLKGFLAKFGFSVGRVRFANVLYSEGMLCDVSILKILIT